MARIRSVKPEFWADEKIGAIPRDARLLFIGLWTLADDYGLLRGSPIYIRSQLFPYDLDFDVTESLDHLERVGCIYRYSHNGQAYIWVCKFEEHQKIDRRWSSKLPTPDLTVFSGKPHQTPPDPTKPRRTPPIPPAGMEWNGMEGNGAGGLSAEAPTQVVPVPEIALELSASQPSPKKRKSSPQEQAYQALKENRIEVLGADALPDENWTPQRINSALKPIIEVKPEVLMDGHDLYLDDDYPAGLDPPYPLSLFVKQWSKYVSMAVRGGQ